MPPKRKPSAPPNRFYKSSIPLQQSRFPLRTTRVKYGKSTPSRVPEQETLTQMAFVNLHRPLDEDDEDLGIYEEETEKPKNKRRKTTGDEPSSDSKYHTQTLTQFGNWSFTAESEEDHKEDDSIYDLLSSSPRSKELRRKKASNVAKPQMPAIQRSSRRKSGPGSMGPPRTPHRRLEREIPSSESPATPPSRSSPSKRPALQERSINIPIPFSTNPKPNPSPFKLPRLRVEDTFESEDVSQRTRVSTTPSKRSSPAKSVRWAETDEIHQIGDSLPSTETEMVTKPIVARPSTQLRDEIMDSEEDDEDYEASEDDVLELDKEERLQPETCYGEIGLETQKLLETQRRPFSPCVEESQALGEMSDDLSEDKQYVDESQLLGERMPDDQQEEKTQYMESQRLATQHVRAMAPRTKISDVFISIRPENVSKIVDRTKNHEFRRQVIPDTVSRIWVYETSPTRVLKYMAAISAAKRPGEIENEDGIGNAEFNAKDPNCGEFAWEIKGLYELADPLPWATIEANEWLISPPRKPTFVRPAVLDQLIANLKPAIFCRPPSMLELTTSSSTDTQEAEEQLLNTMIQYTQVQPSTEAFSSQYIKQEDEDDEEAEDDEEHSYEENEDNETEEKNEDNRENSYFIPQEPTNPDLTHSTVSSCQINKHEDVEEYPLPTNKPCQSTMAPPKEHGTQRDVPSFSQAETVDLSQSQHTPRHHYPTAEIIYESPTRPIFSSTPINLPTPRERENIGPESLVPYSMNSSQLLTKSQMLPESLLYDSVPGRPLCIQDSDEEDEL